MPSLVGSEMCIRDSMCILKSSKMRTLRALPQCIVPKRIVPIFGRMKPRYTRVCLLCLTFKCFFVVFQPIRGPPSFDPMPPIRMPTYGETPSTLHTPHHAIRATHVCAHTPPPRYIDTTYGYYPRSFARPPRSRQIPVLLVWCGVCLLYTSPSPRD